ncbi:lytic murein transglycosylase [Paenibacillus oralis]|uniref:Lytic murein transglycosylase n=1 Tax=Paenibacillus oralis TaxID=2490856 RepID=A0A3P3TE15_9BACL|nr:bifunctional lytic transglycosylase/C40 family peptidase [Paenibacillus oralis]RRJ54683.1 lytic murein transglycosylase [Paenibacillus oralis]
MSATEVGQQAAGQAGGAAKKAGSKAITKAVGKAGKYLKKLLVKFLKQLIMSLGKMIVAAIGPWGILIIIAVLLILALLSAIPFSDWFLGGNARSAEQKNADLQYEQEFKETANATVAELWKIEADKSWVEEVAKTVKPSWGIPSGLVRYEILVNEKKVELSDYKPSKLIKPFTPYYTYTTIKDDKERIKTVIKCQSGTTTDISETKLPKHDVLSKITLDYAFMDIQPLKRYYPGGTVNKTDEWEYIDSSRFAGCTTTRYKQWEHTTVDDRFVPTFNVDAQQFQSILIGLGINQDDMKLFYEFIATADPDWDSTLYGINTANNGISVGWLPGTAKVSDFVLRYEPLVRKYLELYGMEEHTQLVLAIIMQESGGKLLDVMQSSESAGKPRNYFTDPETSIAQGVKHFSQVFKAANGDIKITLQAYNYGIGYVSYALERGGYSKENALEFSLMMRKKQGSDGYGDPEYVDHVLRYYNISNNTIEYTPGDQIFDVQEVLNIMMQFDGTKYFFSGKSPKTGFDCSGLISYAFAKVGIDLSGNAASQYKKTVPVSADEAKPGDLVFWETYRPGPSHVGMYLGNGEFYNSGSTLGVSKDTLNRWKNYPFLGFRRIVK